MLNESSHQRSEEPTEQLLGSFTPAPANIDRDQLMFLAGMRSAQAASAELPSLTLRARLWPALAMVSTAAAVILGVIAWQRPERIVAERIANEQFVSDESPQPSQQMETAKSIPDTGPLLDPALNYVYRRDLMLRDGPEALTSQAVGDSHVVRITPTQRELLKELPGGYHQQYQIDSEAWWQSWLISGDRL